MKNVYFCFLMLFSLIGNTQTNGVVIGVIPIGNLNYAIIQSQSNEYYKTTLFTEQELVINQSVELITISQTEVKVEATTINNNVFALLQLQETSNEIILPPDRPWIENGILFFKDKNHLEQSYNYIADIMYNKDYDVYLSSVESQFLGFVSFRQMLVDKYNWIDGFLTKEEIEQLYKEDFINDEILKSFLNSNREIGIKDSIYFLYDKRTILRIHKENYTSLEDIRENKDVINIYTKSFISNPTITTFGTGIGNVGEGGENEIFLIEDVYGYVDFENNPHKMVYRTIPEEGNANFCSPFIKKIRVNFSAEAVYYNITSSGDEDVWYTYDALNDPNYMQNFIQNGATLTVDWGDNTGVQTYNNYMGWEYVYHTYTSNNTYSIITSFSFIDNLGNTITLVDDPNNDSTNGIHITVGANCVNYSKEKQTESYSNDGTWMFKSKIWTDNNYISKKIGSYSHSYKWNSKKNKWKLTKIKQISSYIYGVYRKDDCSEEDQPKEGYISRIDKKKAQTTKSRLWWHNYSTETGDLFSRHYYLEVNLNSQVRDTIVLNLCE